MDQWCFCNNMEVCLLTSLIIVNFRSAKLNESK